MTSAARVPRRRTASSDAPRRLAIAVGGTATHPETITDTSAEQKVSTKQAVEALLPRSLRGCKSVIVHDDAT